MPGFTSEPATGIKSESLTDFTGISTNVMEFDRVQMKY